MTFFRTISALTAHMVNGRSFTDLLRGMCRTSIFNVAGEDVKEKKQKMIVQLNEVCDNSIDSCFGTTKKISKDEKNVCRKRTGS